MRRILTLVALVALVATPAMANHPWSTYHWNKPGSSVAISVLDHVTSTWDGWLDDAIADWNASSVLDLTEVPNQDTSSSTRRKCSAINGAIKVCNMTYGNNGWLGIASISVSGSHITRCTAKMNDTYHDSAPYNTDGWRDMVMCQEVGHCFGIGHQDENFNNGNLGTCMDYTNNPDGPPSNRAPNNHDYDQILIQHNHSGLVYQVGEESFQTEPPAMRLIQQEGRGQWGELVSSSDDGHQQRYELDFGNGFRIVTHVTWAEGFEGGDDHHHE